MKRTRKLVSQIAIKSDGDVFYEIFKERPYHISNMSPNKVQKCDLHDGQWGKVGSIIFWTYIRDGKERVSKDVIEAIDDEKKSVTFKVIEGDMMELYRTFKFIVQVDTSEENNLVTLTFEYEKKSDDIPDPHTLMDLCLDLTKDIENHHLYNISTN